MHWVFRRTKIPAGGAVNCDVGTSIVKDLLIAEWKATNITSGGWSRHPSYTRCLHLVFNCCGSISLRGRVGKLTLLILLFHMVNLASLILLNV